MRTAKISKVASNIAGKSRNHRLNMKDPIAFADSSDMRITYPEMRKNSSTPTQPTRITK